MAKKETLDDDDSFLDDEESGDKIDAEEIEESTEETAPKNKGVVSRGRKGVQIDNSGYLFIRKEQEVKKEEKRKKDKERREKKRLEKTKKKNESKIKSLRRTERTKTFLVSIFSYPFNILFNFIKLFTKVKDTLQFLGLIIVCILIYRLIMNPELYQTVWSGVALVFIVFLAAHFDK